MLYEIVMDLCGHKFSWNDCVFPGSRVVRELHGNKLTEYEKSLITKWCESDSRKVIFSDGSAASRDYIHSCIISNLEQ